MIEYALAERVVRRALEFVKKSIIAEIKAQGHVASGKLIETIEIRINRTPDKITGGIYMEDYAIVLDRGVKADRVPFSPGSGARSSLYIQSLIDWIATIKPGLGDRERKSFAFAIANKARQEGHPTRGSFSFSQNGRRREWSKHAIDDKQQEIIALMDLSEFVASSIDNFVTDFQRLVVG